MKVTTEKKNANRRNAKKSTGPKSESGKSKVALNGLSHGLRSLKPVIPGVESEKDRETLITRLEPEGAVEMAFAERIALNFWRLGRCAATEAKVSETVREQEYWSEIRQAAWREDYREGNEAGQVINERLEKECEQLMPVVKLWDRIEAGETDDSIDPHEADQLLNHLVGAPEWNKLIDAFNEEFDWPPKTVGQLQEMTEWLSRKLSPDPEAWLKVQVIGVRKQAADAESRRDRIQKTAELFSEIALANSGRWKKFFVTKLPFIGHCYETPMNFSDFRQLGWGR